MKTFCRKIGKHIWAYLAFILAVCVFWSWLFGLLTQVPEEEKISVFIGSRSPSFEKYNELNEARPAYVRALEINVHMVTEPNFPTFLSVFGHGEADILILPESKLPDELPGALYAEISEECRSLLPHLGVFERDGKVYGLRVHDKETHDSLISCLDYGEGETEENYYLLFNRNSLHLGDFSLSEEASPQNGAIVIARRLLSL